MADEREDTAALRERTAALLAKVRTQTVQLRQALDAAQPAPALQARLAAAASEMVGIADTLSHSLDGPDPSRYDIDRLASQVSSLTSETGALVAQASTATVSAAAVALRLEASSIGTRHQVQSLSHDLFERRVFDPYLHFISAEDEAAFREREAASQAYIREQLARGTPEGNLNASGGTLGTMLDAHAHGAGDSPDFLPRWNALAETTQRQHAAMRAAGRSTAEYDRNMEAAVRQLLRQKKHLSDAEIDHILASHADPLEVVKPILEGSRHDRGLVAGRDRPRDPATLGQNALPEVVASPGATIPAASALPLDAMTARLKAAGVRLTDTGDAAPAHGVTVQKPATTPGLGTGA